jgi:hypothetical protein
MMEQLITMERCVLEKLDASLMLNVMMAIGAQRILATSKPIHAILPLIFQHRYAQLVAMNPSAMLLGFVMMYAMTESLVPATLVSWVSASMIQSLGVLSMVGN